MGARRTRGPPTRAGGPCERSRSVGLDEVYQHDDQNRIIGFEDRESPAEAEIVREIVRRLLGGEALRTITDDLNARGVPAPEAGQQRRHRAKGERAEPVWSGMATPQRHAVISIRPRASDTCRRLGETVVATTVAGQSLREPPGGRADRTPAVLDPDAATVTPRRTALPP